MNKPAKKRPVPGDRVRVKQEYIGAPEGYEEGTCINALSTMFVYIVPGHYSNYCPYNGDWEVIDEG